MSLFFQIPIFFKVFNKIIKVLQNKTRYKLTFKIKILSLLLLKINEQYFFQKLKISLCVKI